MKDIKRVSSELIAYIKRVARQPMIKAAAMYAGITGGVKLVAFVKEAVVAAIFGVSGAMDVYLMGLMLIGVPSALILNAIQTSFIPIYVEIREKHGSERSVHFLRSTITITLVILTVTVIVWFSVLPLIIAIVGNGFDPNKQAEVRNVFLWLIPYYFMNGINLLGYGALQADKRFMPSALSPVLTSIATIVIVLSANSASIHNLVLGFVIGSILEWLVVDWRLRSSGSSLFPGALSNADDIWRLMKGVVVLIGGSFLISFSPMIEQTLASGLQDGSIAAMGYAYKLPAMISTILITAVGVTVLPFFAEMLANNDEAACRRAFIHYALGLLVGGSLLALITMLLSDPLVALVFQRGAFSSTDTSTVSAIQRAYLVQIPGALVGMLATRMLVAQRAYGLVTSISALSVALSAILAWLLSAVMNAKGIALGMSLGATISAGALVFLSLKRLEKNTEANRG